MALVKLQPSSPLLSVADTLPEVLSKPNESTFTSLYPESKVGSLLKYVEGYPWTVHYYGQILNRSNSLTHVDPSITALSQPYYEIKDAILQVSSPLSTSYDQATGVTTVNGSALVPFKMTPNVGDFFIAQVDTAEDAVFIITAVQRKTHRKDTLYEVDYNLYQYTSADPDFLPRLQKKVQESYHFNKDSQYYNRDALISPMEHKVSLDLGKLYKESTEMYFDTFYQRHTGTILLPGVMDRVYDPYLMAFIAKTVSYEVIEPGGMHQHSLFDRYAKQPVFWEVLLTRNPRKLSTINTKVAFVGAHSVRNQGRLGTAFHAGLDYVAQPTEPNRVNDIGVYTPELAPEWSRGFATQENAFVYEEFIKTGNNQTYLDKPLLHPLFELDYYVVSENLYIYNQTGMGAENLSYVEWVLMRFIRSEALSKGDVAAALRSYDSWSPLHQLYLLPALWQVVKALN